MVLVFVPSFKAFFLSYFVAMLCTIVRDKGNACSAKAQEGRWVKVLQKSFLPDCFQMCRSPLSERMPAYQSAGSWRHHHGDLYKGQRLGSLSPAVWVSLQGSHLHSTGGAPPDRGEQPLIRLA